MSVWFDGRLVPKETPCLAVDDPAVQWGEGVFTTARVEKGAPLWWGAHCERIIRSAVALGLPVHLPPESAVSALIAANGAQQGIWRLKLALSAQHTWMTLAPYQPPQRPLRVAIYPDPVWRPSGHLKTLAYFDRFWIKRWAEQQSCDEAVTTDGQGHLLEGAFANLLWVNDGVAYTPDSRQLPLQEGLCLQQLEAEEVWPIRRVQATLAQIPITAAAYLCNALYGLCAVSQIGERQFAVQPTLQLAKNKTMPEVLEANTSSP